MYLFFTYISPFRGATPDVPVDANSGAKPVTGAEGPVKTVEAASHFSNMFGRGTDLVRSISLRLEALFLPERAREELETLPRGIRRCCKQ